MSSWWLKPGAFDNPEAEQKRMAYAGHRPRFAYEMRQETVRGRIPNLGLWSTIWNRQLPWTRGLEEERI